MPHSVARFRGCKTVGEEDVWEICKELLDTFRSREKSDALESRLRSRRSSEDDGLRTVRADYSTSLDINEEIKMLEEVYSQERDGYWCKLEVPRINLGSGAARETERDDTRTNTYHRQTVGRQKTNTVVERSSRSRKNRHRGAGVYQELFIRQNILQEDEEGGTADLLWNRG